MPLCWILNAASLTAAGVVLTKQTPSESEAYWKPIEFGSIENYPTSVVITPKGTKQTSTITRYQIGVVIEFVDLNATSIVSEDQFNKFKAARDSLAGYASQCKQAADILSAVVQNYDQVLRYYADGNVLIAGKWISKHDYEAKMKADQLAATAGSIPELVSGGKTFKNVRVTKVVGDRISIMHEGGIASLHASELAEEVRMKLEITFPRHFQKAQETPATPEKANNQTTPANGAMQNPAEAKTLNLDPPADRNLRTTEITFSDSQLALLDDKELGQKLAAQMAECEATLAQMNGRKNTIGKINPLKLEFRVLRKLEHKDFAIVTTPGNGLFEIAYASGRKNGILVTNTTNYTSEGLASLWVVEKGEVKVKLDSGFESTAPVYEELPADAAKIIERDLEDISLVRRLIANAQQLYIDAIHRQDAIEYASRVFPAMVESLQVKLSKKLQTRGFQVEVVGRNMDELRACLVGKEWDKFYQLALEKKADAKLENVSDVARVIDASQRFEWKIVIQAKGFVFANEGGGNQIYLENPKENQREKFIGMVIIPRDPRGLLKLSKYSGPELNFPRYVSCDDGRRAKRHPDNNGIIDSVRETDNNSFLNNCVLCYFETSGESAEKYIDDKSKALSKRLEDAVTMKELGKLTTEAFDKLALQLAGEYNAFILNDVMIGY